MYFRRVESYRSRITRPSAQLDRLSPTITKPSDSDGISTSKQVSNTPCSSRESGREPTKLGGKFQLTCSSSDIPMESVFSVQHRAGPILCEAINRYRRNAIPAWSPLYSTHLAPEAGPIDPELSLLDDEWTSTIGDC